MENYRRIKRISKRDKEETRINTNLALMYAVTLIFLFIFFFQVRKDNYRIELEKIQRTEFFKLVYKVDEKLISKEVLSKELEHLHLIDSTWKVELLNSN